MTEIVSVTTYTKDKIDADFTRSASLRPIRTRKSDAGLYFGTVANQWHDTDIGGSANARPLDIVIPNVKAGDWVEASIDTFSPTAATQVSLDFFTYVGGFPVNQFGMPAVGVVGWSVIAGRDMAINGTATYQLKAGDIENGAVRLRLRDRNTTATARYLFGGSGIAITLEGRGPF